MFFYVDDGGNFAADSICGGREVADANVPNLAANAKSCNGVSLDHGQCVEDQHFYFCKKMVIALDF